MKIGIIGTRSTNSFSINKFEKFIPVDCSEIISGGAMGVDSFAEEFAKEKKINFIKILPDYKTFGKQAPIIRNTFIIEKSQKVIAFWDYKSRGTAHAIKECIRLNVPITIISIKDITKD